MSLLFDIEIIIIWFSDFFFNVAPPDKIECHKSALKSSISFFLVQKNLNLLDIISRTFYIAVVVNTAGWDTEEGQVNLSLVWVFDLGWAAS